MLMRTTAEAGARLAALRTFQASTAVVAGAISEAQELMRDTIGLYAGYDVRCCVSILRPLGHTACQLESQPRDHRM